MERMFSARAAILGGCEQNYCVASKMKKESHSFVRFLFYIVCDSDAYAKLRKNSSAPQTIVMSAYTFAYI